MKQNISLSIDKARQFVVRRKKTSLLILVGLFVIGYGAYAYSQPAAPSRYVIGLAKKGTVVASLSGTGQVLAENQIDIKPATSGTVVSISVANGQSVREGQVIAVLDERAALVSIAQAKASLLSAEASYAKLAAGATGADLQSTQLSVDNSKQDLVTKIKNAYTQTDNLVRTNIDQMFRNPNSYVTPEFQLSFYDSAGNFPVVLTLSDISQTGVLNSDRQDMTKAIAGMKAEADSLNAQSSLSDVKQSAVKTEVYLGQLRNFLTDLGTGINSLYFNATKYKSTVDSYKSTVASARNSADGMLSDLVSGEHALASAESQLAVKVTPARAEDVASAQAQVDSAKANLQSAQNAYSNNVITAPFAGIIAGMTIHRGDSVGGSVAVATLVTKQKVAQIPLNEVDAAKVQLGQKATLTFDALPDLTVAGQVSEIDPLGTVSQGVVTYNVKISFDTQDDRVKPNMSVSAAIVTGVRQDVVTVSNDAIKSKGGVSRVSVASGVTEASAAGGIILAAPPQDVVVETGLSNDTVTEIISGIKEGDAVVTKTISGSAAKSAAGASGLSLLGGSRTGGGAAGSAGARAGAGFGAGR